MAINVSQAFKRTSIAPIDETIALTKAQMLTVSDTLMPAYYFTICQDDGQIYLYDKTATADPTTGKFTLFEGGGGAEIYDTTDTLSDEINGTKTVVAADLPGVVFADLEIGSSIIKDAKGTLGIVTAINGTTDVTVTTATTSTPTKELTRAQYNALSDAVKNNGTIYFITDGNPLPAASTESYSTTEQVVGTWIDGKPLYQKTIVGTTPAGGTETTKFVPIGARVDTGFSVVSVVSDQDGHWFTSFNRNITDASQIFRVNVFSDIESANPNTLRVDCSVVQWVGKPFYATIRYTKTTD